MESESYAWPLLYTLALSGGIIGVQAYLIVRLTQALLKGRQKTEALRTIQRLSADSVSARISAARELARGWNERPEPPEEGEREIQPPPGGISVKASLGS